MPVQVSGEVLALHPVGAYHALTLRAPGVARPARPGHFVALAVGGPESGLLLRRAFSIHRAVPGGDRDTVEVVFAVHGAGTAWLAQRRPGDGVDVVGPLGTPFALPPQPTRCALVGGGYGSAPLFWLAERLRAGGCRTDVVLGAATESRLFGATEAARLADSVTVTTDDGSAGVPGRVTDVLPALLDQARSEVVYACGPMPMLAAVTRVATAAGIPAQTAVEESMACGIGVCMTCVLPVVGADGRTRMVRSCVEGPVFAGERVRWDEVGTVPSDAVGAATTGGPR